MDLEHRGKVVVITGSSRNIGHAIATTFAGEGARVVVNSRNAEALEVAAAEIRAATGAEITPIAVDLMEDDGADRLVAAAVDAFGSIDILINNATSEVPTGNFLELTNETWSKTWNSKLQPYIRMCRAVWPVFEAKGAGVILNVNGLAARSPRPAVLPLGASNAAVLNFTKGLAELGAAANIRVLGVAPGGVKSQRFDDIVAGRAKADGRDIEEVWAEVNAQLPMKRLCSIQEVADVVCFLASPRAGYIAGTTISIDGGALRGLFT